MRLVDANKLLVDYLRTGTGDMDTVRMIVNATTCACYHCVHELGCTLHQADRDIIVCQGFEEEDPWKATQAIKAGGRGRREALVAKMAKMYNPEED